MRARYNIYTIHIHIVYIARYSQFELSGVMHLRKPRTLVRLRPVVDLLSQIHVEHGGAHHHKRPEASRRISASQKMPTDPTYLQILSVNSAAWNHCLKR